MKTSGNTILITGGSSGIGLELVKMFYALDNKIIAVARDASKLADIKNQFPGIAIFHCDVSKPADLDELLIFVEQHHTGLNMLINNAGIQYNYDLLSETSLVNRIDHEINTNLTAAIKLCGLLLPTLLKNQNPAIVNVSSGLALSPKKSAPVYCATKAGIHIFTKALRYQLENTPIKVFEILPPVVDTPMTAGRNKSKITTRQLATEFIADFKRDKFESYIGKTKLLKIIGRLSPTLADRILKNG